MIDIQSAILRLKNHLRSKGFSETQIEQIADKAYTEISAALENEMNNALDLAIQSGVQKGSADFINELRPREGAFVLETESSNTDFSEPPYPMLDRLLTNAKPIKDGSGVYKVIPVGATSSPKKPVHTNIFDAQKSVAAERYENSVSQYAKVTPKDSKVNFRTATSKQNRNTQWVRPEQPKDFTEDLQNINDMLHKSHDEIVLRIIQSYEDGF